MKPTKDFPRMGEYERHSRAMRDDFDKAEARIIGAGCMFATGWAVVTLAVVGIGAYVAIRIWG